MSICDDKRIKYDYEEIKERLQKPFSLEELMEEFHFPSIYAVKKYLSRNFNGMKSIYDSRFAKPSEETKCQV